MVNFKEELVIRIGANSSAFRREMRGIGRIAEKSARETNRRLSRISAAAVVALGSGFAASSISAARFETALVGVSKTTDITGRALEGLGDEIQRLAAETGFASTELLEIAQTAGQLGVSGSANILKFTDTVSRLGTASNLSGEAAAVALARLTNVTGGSIENVDRLASVIVRLGNNFAATESEIAFTAQEIAKAGAQFGVTAEQASALGAAFVSLGVQPELARSTIIQTMVAIRKAIDGGGETFQKFQKITGLTGDQLRQTFAEDATEVFRLFLEGLNRSGTNATAVLGDIGLANTRLLSTLPTLAGGIDIVNDAISQQADELANVSALQTEFERQLDTTERGVDRLRASVNNVAVDIGEKFLPQISKAFNSLADGLEDNRGDISQALDDIFVGMATIVGVAADIGRTVAAQFEMITVSMLRFAARTREIMADLLSGTQNIAGRFGLDLDFSSQIRSLEGQALEFGLDANLREGEIDQTTFGERFAQRLEGLTAFNASVEEEQRRHRGELSEINQQAREEGGTTVLDLFGASDEKFEEDLASFVTRVDTLAELEAELFRRRVAAAEDATERRKLLDDSLVASAKGRLEAEKKFDQAAVDSSFAALQKIVGDNKAAQAALLVVQKAFAISRILTEGQVAALLAFGSQLIPGDPSSLARAEAARQFTLAAARAHAATVAVQAIPEIAGNIFGAQQGGIVPGGFGGGDRVPFLLEPGEVIIPSRLNPLNPDFDETFGEGGGQHRVQVEISLDERASEVLTVKQREDTILGVSQ